MAQAEIDVSSVRDVFISAALRSGELRGGYTYGGIAHPSLSYVVGEDRIEVFFGTRPPAEGGRFLRPDWDRVTGIVIEKVEPRARQRGESA